MNNNCGKFRELISAYIDGALGHSDEKYLKTHIDACGKCRDYLEELKRVRQASLSIPVPDVPEHVYAGVMEEIEKERAPVSAPWNILGNPYFRYALTACAAALICIVVLNRYFREPEISEVKRIAAKLPERPETAGKKVKVEHKEIVRKPYKEAEITAPEKERQLTPEKNIEIAEAVDSIRAETAGRKEKLDDVIVKDVIENMVARGAKVSDARNFVSKSVSGRIEERDISSAARYLSGPRVTAAVTGVTLTEVKDNPFTPNGDNCSDTVKFEYSTAETLKIKLTVYDLAGSVIMEIHKNTPETVEWDGTNKDGRLQEGGIYLYILEIGAHRFKGTVVLAK
ncbi:MAG: gliding motility-associated C-terminal domain-containing protein [bacterium]